MKVIWERCLRLEKCVKLDFPRTTWCVGIEVCIRVLHENGAYFVAAEADGSTLKWKIDKVCNKVVSMAIGNIQICLEPIKNGVRIEARACLDVGPIDDCWTIYGVNVRWVRIAELDKAKAAALFREDDLKALAEDEAHVVAVDEFDTSGVTCDCA